MTEPKLILTIGETTQIHLVEMGLSQRHVSSISQQSLGNDIEAS